MFLSYKFITMSAVDPQSALLDFKFECDVCDYKAMRRENIFYHKKIAHEGVRFTKSIAEKDVLKGTQFKTASKAAKKASSTAAPSMHVRDDSTKNPQQLNC